MRKSFDRPFLIAVIILIIFGFFIFSSASLGLLAQGGGKYENVAFSQTFFGLFIGTIALIATSRISYKSWRKYSFYFFLSALILTTLVFVEGLGLEHAGAKRWLIIGNFSFQPSELLKIAFIAYVASWISGIREKITTVKYGLLPLLMILLPVGFILLNQPDTDTFVVIALSGFAMFLTAGGKWRHIFILIIIAIIGLFVIANYRPYIRDRLTTFVNPAANSQTTGYQIQQSLIAIGSGGIAGRGFGQSIQKFNFLPEPIGDSIFAVAAEEFGFLGGSFIIALFAFFAVRGMHIASRTDDSFGRLLIVGIVILIVSQAFINIGAMLGVLPLTGIPLPFVSHGGTALLITLAEIGIILNISKQRRLRNDSD
jgi:cell division protein FtsW